MVGSSARGRGQLPKGEPVDEPYAGSMPELLTVSAVDRVLDIADYVYILHKGQVAFVGEPGQCRHSGVFERYLGSVAAGA